MAMQGFRNGVVKVKALQLDQKTLEEEMTWKYVSSATVLLASCVAFKTATAVKTISSASGFNRNIKFVNNMVTTAERAAKLAVKGYTPQGEYVEEVVTLSRATAGVTVTNNAFAKVTGIVVTAATKGFGTYGTVSIYNGDKLGIRKYCESEADVLALGFQYGTSLPYLTKTATSYPINSTTFKTTYQTLNLAALAPAGSTVKVTYLGKFQKSFKN